MDKQFQVNDAVCEYGKLSNNLEKHGPDEEVTSFALPFKGVMVDEATANAIAGDPYFTRAIFNDNKGFQEPCTWVREAIRFPEKYDGAVATITLPSDEALTFEDCRIGDIEVMPTPGGLCEVTFQLQLAPGIGRENLLLQEYQHSKSIKLTIADAKVALKKKTKQGELPLAGGGPSENTAGEGDASPDPDASNDDALADADRLLTKLAELGVRPGIEAANWTERERTVAWEWAIAYEADGADCKIARPHWLPIPEPLVPSGEQQSEKAA